MLFSKNIKYYSLYVKTFHPLALCVSLCAVSPPNKQKKTSLSWEIFPLMAQKNEFTLLFFFSYPTGSRDNTSRRSRLYANTNMSSGGARLPAQPLRRAQTRKVTVVLGKCVWHSSCTKRGSLCSERAGPSRVALHSDAETAGCRLSPSGAPPNGVWASAHFRWATSSVYSRLQVPPH